MKTLLLTFLFAAVSSPGNAATFTHQAYLKASNSESLDTFGRAVAVSGNTIIVGANGESSNAAGANGNGANNAMLDAGAVYVFVRTGTLLNPIWTQQAYLKAANPDSGDQFGESVAISGDTIVVGAPFEDSNATGVNGDGSNNSRPNSGAAYVFVRNGTNWTQQAYLKANNAGGDDQFGTSVAISGDTIVVGAPKEASNATGVNGNGNDNSATESGAAYVFVRSGTTWSQQAYLKASNTDAGDRFGQSVGVSGNNIIVGAPGEDSIATGVDGNGANNSIMDSGAAYIFARSGTTWSQQAYLKASNTGTGDGFGFSVAISGSVAVVGAPSEASNATGANGDGSNNSAPAAGAAYVFFFRNGPTQFGWIQRAYLKASNTDSGDDFGNSVAVSGLLVVVGANLEDSNGTGVNGASGNNFSTDSGAAYVYAQGGTLSNPTWTFRDYLKASNTDAGDGFGTSIAVSGGTIVVGADLESSSAFTINGNGNDNSASGSGAAYVFEQTAGEVFVEQPPGLQVTNNGSRDVVVIGGTSASVTFTIRNNGNDNLAALAATIDGADASLFTITATPATTLAPGASTSCTVQFAPTDAAAKTATLRIASSDSHQNPFNVALNGYTLSFTQDSDGDGLSDAAEYLLASLGFDWKTSQSALVNTLFANASAAGLFTQSQLQALSIDSPLLARDSNTGLFKLTIGLQKATQLTNFVAFPMTAPQTTINGHGELEFQFSSPENAAFFRLEAH